jgi:toxin ParE1/3/4
MTGRFDVRMSAPAEQDIESIYDYLHAHGSPDIAGDLLAKLLDRIDSLEFFPMRGAIVPEVEVDTDELRQFVVGVYRGIHVVEDDVVLIVAVIDGRRNVGAFLQERLVQRPD